MKDFGQFQHLGDLQNQFSVFSRQGLARPVTVTAAVATVYRRKQGTNSRNLLTDFEFLAMERTAEPEMGKIQIAFGQHLDCLQHRTPEEAVRQAIEKKAGISSLDDLCLAGTFGPEVNRSKLTLAGKDLILSISDQPAESDLPNVCLCYSAEVSFQRMTAGNPRLKIVGLLTLAEILERYGETLDVCYFQMLIPALHLLQSELAGVPWRPMAAPSAPGDHLILSL